MTQDHGRSQRGAFAFGPDRRILRRADFLRVQSDGVRTATPHFVLLVTATPQARQTRSHRGVRPTKDERDASDSVDSLGGAGRARLGIVVTKKIGSAPVRNRIKRLCRECFRLWPDFLPDGVDLVVIARNGAGELGLADVQAEWSRARSAVLKRCAAVLRGANAQKGAEGAT